LNKSEKDARSYSVVDTPNQREVTVKEKAGSSLTKTFGFDRVFGPNSKQFDVYRAVVEPLIGQVMQGYNCTVFAYGQTGTGKTYTMEGGEGRDDPNTTWENDPTAGIVPRALAQLFDELRVQQEAEFSVRVSYLELYNEEIFDLLSPADDTTRLRLYEDSTKKGSVIIQGLEEVQVHNKNEVYTILEKGSFKRKTAETLMNASSSRSHTVFTVTVHLKESSMEGEEVLRIGKLNLVDLAGSENIGRSGAQDKRAREAGNINQSLLTLGRVITCLVERTPHIPYRESKLTRLLQDSLGGRTKTSIIATVSPAGINLEETMSTLDYAHRAKNIQNKPEVNQKLSKKAVLKEYTEEIERLRRDLMASREKNGVYLANDNYQSLLVQIESQAQEITEKIGQIKAMKEEMEKNESVYIECNKQLKETTEELDSTNTRLKETSHTLNCTKAVLSKTAAEREEQAHLVEKHVETELKLSGQASKLLTVSDQSAADLKLLHEKVERVKGVEDRNETVKEEFSTNFTHSVSDLLQRIVGFQSSHGEACEQFISSLHQQFNISKKVLEGLGSGLEEMVSEQGATTSALQSIIDQYASTEHAWTEKQSSIIKEAIAGHSDIVNELNNKGMKPALEQININLTEKSVALANLETSVVAEFSLLVETFNRFAAEIAGSIAEVERDVLAYSGDTTRRMEAVMAENAAMMDSETAFKSVLDSMMSRFADHSSLVAASTARTSQSATDTISAGKQLTDSITRRCEETRAARTEVERKARQHAVDITAKVAEKKEFCLSLNANTEEQAKVIRDKTAEFVSNSGQKLKTFETTTLVQLTEQKDNAASMKESMSVEMMKGRQRLEAYEAATQLTLTEMRTEEGARQEQGENRLGSLKELTEERYCELKERLQEQETNVLGFLEQDLQKDIPSGKTPARTERSYPRFLAATSPHQRILERYRQTAEVNVAARLPLDVDDDDDDSVISASTQNTEQAEKISRQNSSSSMTSNVSSRRGNTRSVSREHSAEFKPKSRSVAGSVSDLGSLASEDTENRDPFTKPTSTRSARPGKREIPRPEIRTRKHLGSTN